MIIFNPWLEMLKLHFNFTVDKENTSTEVKTFIERKENIVSFSLEYKMKIIVDKGKCISVQKCDKGYIYVFEFGNINDAIFFEENKECKVISSSFFCDPKDIEKDIVNYAEHYINTKGIKKKQRKRLIEDENGFKRYI